ncbi:MAG: GIY-YIG nuclease family protein [Pseudanabaena sp. ELA607]|jgi:hypothetical protein
MSQKRHGYHQGSLWGEQETKAIQKQTVESKLRHKLADQGATYRIAMNAATLTQWKQGILNHQLGIRSQIQQQNQINGIPTIEQSKLLGAQLEASLGSLFDSNLDSSLAQGTAADGFKCRQIDPFELAVYPAEFYRLPQLVGNDACIYFVIDQSAQLLLYVGETCRSQKRWQGAHDCKRYIQNYQLLHYQHQQPAAVVITFAWDVPQSPHQRKQLEQQLIQLWRSPFNRENWHHWQAPFIYD